MENIVDLEYATQWQIDAGVDATLGDAPFDMLSNPKTEITPTKQSTSYVVQATLDSCEASRRIYKETNTLEELRLSMEKFDGCSLKQTATNTVFGSGKVSPKIMIIGLAPNADDDRLGKAFASLLGEFLDKMIRTIDIKREDCYLSNVLAWRPPGNRTPTETEISICLPFIKKQIELVNPEYIYMLGGSVANVLFDNNEPISQLRGKIFEYKKENGELIKTIISFHPSYLLLNPIQKAKAWNDLIRLKRLFSENS